MTNLPRYQSVPKYAPNAGVLQKRLSAVAAHNTSRQVKTLCSTCLLCKLCSLIGLMPNEFSQPDAIIRQGCYLKKGGLLFRAREPFISLPAIRAGPFKVTVVSQDGRDQVISFPMSGGLIGVDGICSHTYSCDAVASEDNEVCELPLSHIEELGQNTSGL